MYMTDPRCTWNITAGVGLDPTPLQTLQSEAAQHSLLFPTVDLKIKAMQGHNKTVTK